jgi:hypothetical protein
VCLAALLGRAQGVVDAGVTPAGQLAVARDGALVAFETFGDVPASSRTPRVWRPAPAG